MPDEATRMSPTALAMRAFWRGGSNRFGVAVLAAMALLAVYAPFIAGETALLWRDEAGWSSPVVAELFDANAYPAYYQLCFNVLALLLPPIALGWILLRRRWSLVRRALVAAAIVALGFFACVLPLQPTTRGMEPLWRERPPTGRDAQALAQAHGVSAVLPPVPHRFGRSYPGQALKPPLARDSEGSRFWLGTDPSGKDVLAYLVFGARVSLTIGILSTALSLAIGILVGAVSGYFGGRVDLLLQRLVEIMLCFPVFVLVLVVVAMTSRNIVTIMVVLGLTGWAGIARLVRGEFLAQSVRDYVAAAESLGLPRWRIMFRHILPNALTPLFITATFGIAGAILTESAIAFLGLGDPNTPSWGLMLDDGRHFIAYWWIIYAPGTAIFLLVTGLNLVGNGLQQALDPKAAK